MELNEYEKSATRFHLGFNAGAQIPAGDRSRLEEAMAMIPDEYCITRLFITSNVAILRGKQVLQFQMTS